MKSASSGAFQQWGQRHRVFRFNTFLHGRPMFRGRDFALHCSSSLATELEESQFWAATRPDCVGEPRSAPKSVDLGSILLENHRPPGLVRRGLPCLPASPVRVRHTGTDTGRRGYSRAWLTLACATEMPNWCQPYDAFLLQTVTLDLAARLTLS
eukprot:3688136-Prymnesium_polylepis.1